MRTRVQRVQEHGQAIAAMGIVTLLFVLLTLGIVDFGRMLMVMNVVTHAARDGARTAALTSPADWPTSQGALVAEVQRQIATVTATPFTVTRNCTVLNGRPQASVEVQGNEPFLFRFVGLWGGDVTIDRTATFRYEGSQSNCP